MKICKKKENCRRSKKKSSGNFFVKILLKVKPVKAKKRPSKISPGLFLARFFKKAQNKKRKSGWIIAFFRRDLENKKRFRHLVRLAGFLTLVFLFCGSVFVYSNVFSAEFIPGAGLYYLNGKIGIGTNNPTAALQVAGNVNIYPRADGTFQPGDSVVLNLADANNNLYVKNGSPVSFGAYNGVIFRTNSLSGQWVEKLGVNKNGALYSPGNGDVAIQTPGGSWKTGDQVVLDFGDSNNNIYVKFGGPVSLGAFNGLTYRTNNWSGQWVEKIGINKNGALTSPVNDDIAIQTPTGSWASGDKVALDFGDRNNNIFVQFGQPMYFGAYNGYIFRAYNGGTAFSQVAAISNTGNLSANSFQCLSDVRYKKEIKPISNALEKVMSLNGVTYFWNKENFPQISLPEGRQVGLIAQEVEKVLPEVVGSDNNGYKNVDYGKISALLINAVKELKADNDQLRSEIEALKFNCN